MFQSLFTSFAESTDPKPRQGDRCCPRETHADDTGRLHLLRVIIHYQASKIKINKLADAYIIMHIESDETN
jgi:hypothetical protein